MMGDVLKESYLIKAPDVSKHLHNTKKWQRKWFSLDGSGDLTFFESEKSTKPNGVLHIWQCTLLFDPKTKSIPHSFCIGLEFADYSTYLKAETALIFNEWLRQFRKFSDRCVLEELPGSSAMTTSFDQFGSRLGSISSVQSARNFSSSVQSRLPRKEGFMGKTGGNNKGWKDRYFVLAHGKLAYYKNEKSVSHDAALGFVSMADCSKVTKTAGKKGFGFDLHTPSRVYNFSVDSETEQKEWTEVMIQTMDTLSDHRGSSPKRSLAVEKRLSVGSNASGSSLERILEKSSDHGNDDGADGGTDSAGKDHCGLSHSGEAPAASQEGEGKDGVVLLLEAEVEALRSKVDSLEADLRSSSSVNSQLQDQLVSERREKEMVAKTLQRDKEDMKAQVEQLERTKEELEGINDSVETQLEEQQEKAQDLEEELLALRHELDELQGDSNAAEEELSQTQMKLQEIEEVARNLEAALRKRGDSEPPPDLSSLRSLNMSYKAKMATEEPASSVETPAGEAHQKEEEEKEEEDKDANGEVAAQVSELQERLSASESENKELKQRVKDLQTSSSSLESENRSLQQQAKKFQSSIPQIDESLLKSEAVERLIHEEQLKWQVEVDKIRKEMESKLEGERREWKEKREAEVAKLEREVEVSKSSHQQAGKLQDQLRNSQKRVEQLEGEVSTLSERVTELLAEKEKALADLKNIRKVNRSMEKKLSETEEYMRSASRTSMSSMGSSGERSPPPSQPPPSPQTPESSMKSADRINTLQALLNTAEKERDDFKKQVEELSLELARRRSADKAPVSSPAKASMPSALNFFGKASATVGTSGQAVGGQTLAPPTAALRNGLASSASADPEIPPPKPKKPPKELVDILSSPNSNRHSTARMEPLSISDFDETANAQPSTIRSRTMSVLQTIFARR